MNSYSEQLHVTYQKGASAFLNSYKPTNSTELTNEIDSYFRACALCLWATFDRSISDCISALNEIYTKETSRKSYSGLQIETAMNYINAQSDIVPMAPDFFIDIINRDITDKTVFSRAFAEGMQIILSMFAMIDNKVTFEEARTIALYYQILIDECDRNRIQAFDQEDPFSFITTKNEKNAQSISPKNPTTKSILKTIGMEQPEIRVDETMKELDKLEGLTKAKEDVNTLVNFVKIRSLRNERGLPTPPMSFHLVFTGNPGTGKTTVARIIAKIYKALGILSKGQMIEVDRSGLVAGYVGQTAIKTQEVLQSALGGVLFIDEAYSLSQKDGNDFGQEAVDTMLKFMEDHRDDLIVIVAGYSDLMHNFINSNPGLKSRFNKYILFEDYNGDEMLNIFTIFCNTNKYEINDEAKALLREFFQCLYINRKENFGNARDVRNLFEQIITAHSNRIVQDQTLSEKDLITITESDVDRVLHDMQGDRR